MVNKFGDEPFGDGVGDISVQVIKKVKVTRGKYSDYIDKISASHKLGFQPYQIKEDGRTLLIFAANGSVFSLGSVCCGSDVLTHRLGKHHGKCCVTETLTNLLVTEREPLVYWVRSESVDDGAYMAAIKGREGELGPRGFQGERGLQGSIGPQGLLGKTGQKGGVGPRGEQGLQGAVGSQGLQGEKGTEGSRGRAGPQGEQGGEGSQGVKGETGLQ